MQDHRVCYWIHMTFVDEKDGFITSHYCTSVSCHSVDLGFDQQVWVERSVMLTNACVCVSVHGWDSFKRPRRALWVRVCKNGRLPHSLPRLSIFTPVHLCVIWDVFQECHSYRCWSHVFTNHIRLSQYHKWHLLLRTAFKRKRPVTKIAFLDHKPGYCLFLWKWTFTHPLEYVFIHNQFLKWSNIHKLLEPR